MFISDLSHLETAEINEVKGGRKSPGKLSFDLKIIAGNANVSNIQQNAVAVSAFSPDATVLAINSAVVDQSIKSIKK